MDICQVCGLNGKLPLQAWWLAKGRVNPEDPIIILHLYVGCAEWKPGHLAVGS